MHFDHFDLVAGLYNRSAPYILQEPLAELLALQKDNRLLDAGGGTGRVASALRGRVREVVVADPSLGMLHYASANGLAAICTPAESFPFVSGTFDRIVMLDALHHVSDRPRTANELWRVLSPGGRILIVEPDIQKTIIKFLALGEKMLLMRSHFLSGEKIAALFKHPAARVSVIYCDNNATILVQRVREM